MAPGVVGKLFLLLVFTTGCRECRQEKGVPESIPQNIGDVALEIDGQLQDGWEITNFGGQGPVTVSGDEIVLGMGEGCTGITWKGTLPVSDYQITLEAKRVSGNDFFCGMTFPAGKEPCTLIVGGWGGTTVGLSCIDGMDASENSTTKLMRFEKDRWYDIRLAVTASDIKAWIDTVQVVDLKISGHTLSVRPEVELSRPFGIASWNTTAALRNIKIKTDN